MCLLLNVCLLTAVKKIFVLVAKCPLSISILSQCFFFLRQFRFIHSKMNKNTGIITKELLSTEDYSSPRRHYFTWVPLKERMVSERGPRSLPKCPYLPMFPHFSLICSLFNLSSYHLPPSPKSTFSCCLVPWNTFMSPFSLRQFFPCSPKPLGDAQKGFGYLFFI